MSLDSIKEKVISGLKNRSVNVLVNYQFSDELGLKFKYGEINLVELISQITEDLPFTIVETFTNNFYICDKKTKFPFNNYIDPKNLQKIWDDENEAKFINAYPELKQLYANNRNEIKSASCSSCAKNGKILALLNEFSFLSHNNRDNKFLSDIYGENFYNKILDHTPQKRTFPPVPTTPMQNTQNRPQPPQPPQPPHLNQPPRSTQQPTLPPQKTALPTPRNNFSLNSAPRESCVNCSLKHLASSITLLQESKQGLPAHRWLAIGELNEASNEMLRDYPEIAEEIKNVRVELTSDSTKIPLVMNLLEKIDKKFSPDLYSKQT